MELIIKKIIGQTVYPFTVSGKNLHECVMESQKLSFPHILECGICGSDDLYLSAHVAEGYKYTEVRCNKCRAELTFGLRKDDPDVSFFRKNDDGSLAWKKFDPKPAETGTAPAPQVPPQNTQAATKQPAQNQPKAGNTEKAAASPKTNNTAKPHRNTKPLADAKPSGKAINYAMKIAAVGTDAALKDLGSLIKQDAVINKSETDIKYLQTEYLKKFHAINNPQAVAEQREHTQLQA